jgi:DNA-binding SARP family transcriptional activator
MRCEILGPIRIVRGKEVRVLTARKQEVLLATLLIRANQVASAQQLVTELWGDKPPRQASACLYVYISELRKILHEHGGQGMRIVTRSPGYMLQTPSEDIDADTFQAAMSKGRRSLDTQAPGEAVAALRFALSLWRGPVLGGLRGGPIITSYTVWLEECRLECVELLSEALLTLGEYRESISLLYSMIHDYPLRESFYRLLMLGLYRAGRQADALRIYQQARDVTVAELGLEPTRSLRDLHQAILVGDYA